MILRRVIEHVRKQEWTAIFIDFVIVVAGVFVGIQVSNWNAAIADVKRGDAYQERLAVDLDANLKSRRNFVAYYAAVLDSIERATALFADPNSDPEELIVHAYRASEIIYGAQVHATWDEIVSAGDAGLLGADLLNSGLSDYFADDTARTSFQSLQNSRYRHRVRTLIPLSIQKALRAGCSDVRAADQQITGFMAGCTLDVPPELIAETAAALRADKTVQEELRYQYSEVYSARANISGDVILLERAIKALDGEEGAVK